MAWRIGIPKPQSGGRASAGPASRLRRALVGDDPESSNARFGLIFSTFAILLLILSAILSGEGLDQFFSSFSSFNAVIPRLKEGSFRDLLLAVVAAQVAITGLILPIAIALITFTTERGARSTTLRIYFRRSRAQINLYSALQLAVAGLAVLAIVHASPVEFRPFFRFAILSWFTLWLSANVLLTAQFIGVTLRYVSPETRAKSLIDATVADAIERAHTDAAKGLAFGKKIEALVQAGLVTTNRFWIEAPKHDLTFTASGPLYLHDVRLPLLGGVLRLQAFFRKVGESPLDIVCTRFGPMTADDGICMFGTDLARDVATPWAFALRKCFIVRELTDDAELFDIERIAVAIISEALNSHARRDHFDYGVHLSTWGRLANKIADDEDVLAPIISARNLTRTIHPLLAGAVDSSLEGDQSYLVELFDTIAKVLQRLVAQEARARGSVAPGLLSLFGHAVFLSEYRNAFVLRLHDPQVVRIAHIAGPMEEFSLVLLGKWENLATYSLGVAFASAQGDLRSARFALLAIHLLTTIDSIVVALEFGDGQAAKQWAGSLVNWPHLFAYIFRSRVGYRPRAEFFGIDDLVAETGEEGSDERQFYGAAAVEEEAKVSALVSLHADLSLLAAAIALRVRASSPNSADQIIVGLLRQDFQVDTVGGLHGKRLWRDPRLHLISLVRLVTRNTAIAHWVENHVSSWTTLRMRWISGRVTTFVGSQGASLLMRELAILLAYSSRRDWTGISQDQGILDLFMSHPDGVGSSIRLLDRLRQTLSSVEADPKVISLLGDGIDREGRRRIALATEAVDGIVAEIKRRELAIDQKAVVDPQFLQDLASECRSGISAALRGEIADLPNPPIGPVQWRDAKFGGATVLPFRISIAGISKRSISIGSDGGYKQEQLRFIKDTSAKLAVGSVYSLLARRAQWETRVKFSIDEVCEDVEKLVTELGPESAVIFAQGGSLAKNVLARLGAAALRHVLRLDSPHSEVLIVDAHHFGPVDSEQQVSSEWKDSNDGGGTGELRVTWKMQLVNPVGRAIRLVLDSKQESTTGS